MLCKVLQYDTDNGNLVASEATMDTEREINIAIDIAREYHAGHVDKANEDYFAGHLTRVARFARPDIAAAAWLHDVLEDTTATEEVLRARGISDDTIEIVKILTKADGAKYAEFIDGIINTGNVDAITVKAIDVADHLRDTTHITDRAVDKYTAAIKRLGRALIDKAR